MTDFAVVTSPALAPHTNKIILQNLVKVTVLQCNNSHLVTHQLVFSFVILHVGEFTNPHRVEGVMVQVNRLVFTQQIDLVVPCWNIIQQQYFRRYVQVSSLTYLVFTTSAVIHYITQTRSSLCLQMAYHLSVKGHQQTRYWLKRPGCVFLCFSDVIWVDEISQYIQACRVLWGVNRPYSSDPLLCT